MTSANSYLRNRAIVCIHTLLVYFFGGLIHHIFAMFIGTASWSSYSCTIIAGVPWQLHVTRSPTFRSCAGGSSKNAFILCHTL